MTRDEYKALWRIERQAAVKRKSKYNAVKTEVDGFKFDSKLEARYYRILKKQIENGEYYYFLRQVPFHLPGNYKMVVDFMLVGPEGPLYVDVKGMPPIREWINKKKAVEAHYPVFISIADTETVKNLARIYGIS